MSVSEIRPYHVDGTYSVLVYALEINRLRPRVGGFHHNTKDRLRQHVGVWTSECVL